MKKGLLLIAAIIFIAFNSNAQFSDDFQGDTSGEGATGWTTVSPNYNTNPYKWTVRDYSGSLYLSAACWDGSSNNATEQWAITPKLNASGVSSISVTFDNKKRHAPYQDLEVYVSTDFDGDSAHFATATWVPVTGFTLDSDDSDQVWEEATVGTATITGNATTYIAFKFVSTDSQGGNWTIDNVSVNAPVAFVDNISVSAKLYPNPASSVLNIQSEVNIASITVANVIGQKVLSINNVNADNYKLNVEDLNNGVYLISINNVDGTSAVTKFVKK